VTHRRARITAGVAALVRFVGFPFAPFVDGQENNVCQGR
jgi:hypothetical protein